MANGGKRKGAGRKKGFKAIEAEKAREFLAKRISEEFDPIITAQIESAKGLYYEDEGKKIYRIKPDTKTGEYLINQQVGKPKETVELQNDITLKLDV